MTFVKNGRNGKIHGSTYLGAGKLVVIKVGDGRLRPPIGGLIKVVGCFFAYVLITPNPCLNHIRVIIYSI